MDIYTFVFYAYGVDHSNILFFGGDVILLHGKPEGHSATSFMVGNASIIGLSSST